MVVFALTLIRHGETAHNKDNVIQGQLDVPLSQTGLQQAELLGFHLQYQHYSHVYVSDLTRAKQTAESIIKLNKSFKASLFHDCRLRERKFGNVEGKSFKFLREAAAKSSLNTSHYTPPGGETIQQVRDRAISFFKDLCEMVIDCSNVKKKCDLQNNSNCFSQINNGKTSGQKRKWETDSLKSTDDESKSEEEVNPNESLKDSTADSNLNDQRDINCGSDSNCQSDEVVKTENDTSFSSETVKSNDSESDSVTPQNGCDKNHKYVKSENGHFSVSFTDDDIRSQIMSKCNDVPDIECPNVSLSPLVDQNFISSSFTCGSLQESEENQGRRLSVCSSCDDVDSGLSLTANVLVVSHGGWLRELLRHFVEDLECSVPGGQKQALRISPNAGLSKFTVSLEDNDGHPKIICLQIHDKQHLLPTTYNDKIFSPDEIAL